MEFLLITLGVCLIVFTITLVVIAYRTFFKE